MSRVMHWTPQAQLHLVQVLTRLEAARGTDQPYRTSHELGVPRTLLTALARGGLIVGRQRYRITPAGTAYWAEVRRGVEAGLTKVVLGMMPEEPQEP